MARKLREMGILVLILLLTAPLTGIAAGIGEDYVRPAPRKTLSFSWPWNRKHSDGPQQADLAKVDRERTPWLLALLHVPWYNSNWAHQGEGDDMMAVVEPVLYAAGVDILIAGHVHAYERSFLSSAILEQQERVYSGQLDSCGAIHITVGDGGNREGLALRYHHPKPIWSAFREASFGHGELKIVNATHAFWSWHRNDDHESLSSDEVWINSLASAGCLRSEMRDFSKIQIVP
ncbi:Purple acid phosphatase 18 [Dendrobium catenatum]|uniref:Purple acid phosphatase 18 n=1 Tax=Dendrobium catenatum TaxID=906689 RepID=A0A2I0VGB9_9ASPA|nr:Purple acid phosphatase 18 [Dendrobium catenatum]